MTTTIAISTAPNASANGKSPLLVSSEMAVVITRVTPSILPPTIITAPTSAMARPNPASTAVVSVNRISHSRARMHCMRLALRETSCSRYSPQASSITCRASAAMMGKINSACATIIAAGVNRMPSAPNGPARDSSRYTSSPTTTGGRPIMPFSTAMTACRPGKRASASQAPNGNASSDAVSTAMPDTRNDKPAIDSMALFSDRIRAAASERLSAISCMSYQFQIVTALICRHSHAGENPSLREENWIPACAGMTACLLIHCYGNRIRYRGLKNPTKRCRLRDDASVSNRAALRFYSWTNASL